MADASGLAPTDAAALNTVGLVPGCSVGAVQVTVGITQPGTVRTVNRLVAAGLVERRAGVDGRTVALYLTEDGERVWRRLAEGRLSWLDQVLERLPDVGRADVERVVSALLSVLTGDEESAERICRFCDERRCPQDRCPVTLGIGTGS